VQKTNLNIGDETDLSSSISRGGVFVSAVTETEILLSEVSWGGLVD
jgi:hypothetical protein